MSILEDKSTVIVIFAGLMFFHYNEPSHFFKVGILKHAPYHELGIYGPNAQKVLAKVTAKTAVRPQQSAYPDDMVLEVVDQNGTTMTEATFYQKGIDFDRKYSKHDPEDYRYIVSFDELYPGGHSIEDGSLGPNIYIRAGQLRTLCRTDFLRSRKGRFSTTDKDFGHVADLMGLTVELQKGQSLVLSGTDLKVDYSPEGKEQYAVIANIPSQEHRCPKSDHCKNFDTHFQHYYSAVDKPFYKKYDFGYKSGQPAGCNPSMPAKIVEYLRNLKVLTQTQSPYSKKAAVITTPPPYFCGIASTSKEWSLSGQPPISKQPSPGKKRSPSKKH